MGWERVKSGRKCMCRMEENGFPPRKPEHCTSWESAPTSTREGRGRMDNQLAHDLFYLAQALEPFIFVYLGIVITF